jgi:hypothetical protein
MTKEDIMRHRISLACLLLLAVLSVGLLASPAPAATVQEQITTISATQTNSALTFAVPPGILIIINDGPDAAYVTVASTTATAAKFLLRKGESLAFPFISETQAAPTGMGVICATGQTASIRVGAWR